MNYETLTGPGGVTLGYRYVAGLSPTVVFLGGFRSDMTGEKASYVESLATALGYASLRLDYSGHGVSGGDFELGCISSWTADAHAVINAVTEGPLILVGSSMGGWIMRLLDHQNRPQAQSFSAGF